MGDLPKTRKASIEKLETDYNIVNECLGSYIEFKRVSLGLIF